MTKSRVKIVPAPTDPASTLRFLQRFQRLLQSSDYTTTYKFALLKVLCDLAIELPTTSTEINIDELSDRFIAIYWFQSRQFRDVDLHHGGSKARPARAISLAKRWRSEFRHDFTKLQESKRIHIARREMRSLIQRNVLWRLQPKGQPPLLYRYESGSQTIRMEPLALESMRSLHMLMSDLIESQWTRWVQRRNPGVTGEGTLRDHLFGIDRRQLRKVVPRLMALQGGRSFYGKAKIREDHVHVDHFIPWSICRHDALGNLVLCTPGENLRFSDSLKPPAIRCQWEARNAEQAEALRTIAEESGLRWDPSATQAIAEWAYRTAP